MKRLDHRASQEGLSLVFFHHSLSQYTRSSVRKRKVYGRKLIPHASSTKVFPPSTLRPKKEALETERDKTIQGEEGLCLDAL